MEEITFLHIFIIFNSKNKDFSPRQQDREPYAGFELSKPVVEFKHSEVGKPLADFTVRF